MSTETYVQGRADAFVRGPTPGEPLERQVPTVTDEAMRWRFEEQRSWAPRETYVLEMDGGRVYGEGVVITPENQILQDVSTVFTGRLGEHWLQHRGPLPRARRVKGRLAVLASAAEDGYFHWLFDVVPRLDLLEGVPYDRILVGASRPFQRVWLDMLQIRPEDVLASRPHGHWQPDTLVVPSLPCDSGQVTSRSCRVLRAVAERCGGLSESPPVGGRRLYVSRADAGRRRVTNESEVLRLLKECGFECVHPGALSAQDQIHLFSEASVVVGPHGAGLSNLVFCPPGARVLELFAPSYVNVCFWALSQHVGLRYTYLLARGERPRPGTTPSSVGEDLEIDLRALRTAVDALDIS